MGVHCEINLIKPAVGGFTPGSVVTGNIKYSIDKETVFKRITVSLKGKGHLLIKHKKKRNRSRRKRNSEEYVNVGDTIHSDEHGENALPIGSYETEFKFQLPEKIPSSLHYSKHLPRYVVKCHIAYYVRIEFEKPGRFKFNKKFKKEVIVISGITPRSPNVPTVCAQQKTLTQWFSTKKRIIDIKVTIQNVIVKPGDKLILEYKVNNDTDIVIKSVEAKLVEIFKFISRGGHEVTSDTNVKDTDSKTGSIQPGHNKTMPIELIVPYETGSLDYSKIVTRDYVVCVTANLPIPHRDAVLKIPVQIGHVDTPTRGEDEPPSYWEAMSEYAKRYEKGEESSDSDDENLSK